MVLSLFFTRGVSLKLWVDSGLFDREKLIYEKHLQRGNFKKIYWFTYGVDDKILSEELKQKKRLHKNIEIFDMPKIFSINKIGSWFYLFFLPFIYKKQIKKSAILKTNQMDGSLSAVIAKWLCKKPLIVRTGYTITQLLKNTNASRIKIKAYEYIEKFVYKNCDKAIVTSYHNQKYLENFYGVKNIQVVSNFIDINLFKQLNLIRYEDRLIFVGRLNKEKNLFNLIEAISKTDIILDIYGQGNLEKKLKKFTKRKDAKVNFMGVVANEKLPIIYNKYKYYILPSYSEGMPKTLLEAMACGCACIGTNVKGINEVIEDGINGFLSENVSFETINKTIERALQNEKQNEITKNAIKKIEKEFSLDFIIEKEKNIFLDITEKNKI